jgi:hypothetical protein
MVAGEFPMVTELRYPIQYASPSWRCGVVYLSVVIFAVRFAKKMGVPPKFHDLSMTGLNRLPVRPSSSHARPSSSHLNGRISTSNDCHRDIYRPLYHHGECQKAKRSRRQDAMPLSAARVSGENRMELLVLLFG